MEFQKLIESRRSIRKYDGSKKVTKEQIETLIAAATEAPSWKNSETARYYCVLSDEMTKRVREECLPGFNRERSDDQTKAQEGQYHKYQLKKLHNSHIKRTLQYPQQLSF